jgi:hypothetical protein
MPVLFLFAFLILVVAIGPLLTIWAWNTLFGAALMIEYTFWTWLAVIFLVGALRANVEVKK